MRLILNRLPSRSFSLWLMPPRCSRFLKRLKHLKHPTNRVQPWRACLRLLVFRRFILRPVLFRKVSLLRAIPAIRTIPEPSRLPPLRLLRFMLTPRPRPFNHPGILWLRATLFLSKPLPAIQLLPFPLRWAVRL